MNYTDRQEGRQADGQTDRQTDSRIDARTIGQTTAEIYGPFGRVAYMSNAVNRRTRVTLAYAKIPYKSAVVDM